VCRKAPAAVAVQGRHQVPSRFHKGPGSCRSGGAGPRSPRSPRTCCRRVSAADSPGNLRQPQLPSGLLANRTCGIIGRSRINVSFIAAVHSRDSNFGIKSWLLWSNHGCLPYPETHLAVTARKPHTQRAPQVRESAPYVCQTQKNRETRNVRRIRGLFVVLTLIFSGCKGEGRTGHSI
jgi:hypothetical protein